MTDKHELFQLINEEEVLRLVRETSGGLLAMQTHITELEADNARLRAGLHKVVSLYDASVTNDVMIEQMRDTARKALEED